MSDGRPTLRVERSLRADPAAVWAAWTDPDQLRRWFSPTGYAEVEADVRVGGRLRVVMVGDGRRIEHSGKYLIVEPERSLSFTWRSIYTDERDTIVTVTLEPVADGTILVLSHEGLSAEAAGSHAGGWGALLDLLGQVLMTTSADTENSYGG